MYEIAMVGVNIFFSKFRGQWTPLSGNYIAKMNKNKIAARMPN